MATKSGRSIQGVRRMRSKAQEPAKSGSGKDQYFSRAVAKALETLEVLQASNGPMALNEVAQRLQLSKTSAFRLLRTLEASGCLAASEGGKYALAPGVHAVGSTQTVARLRRAAIPCLQQLSRQLRETASLAALFDNRIEVIAVVESPQQIRMSNVVGHILPPNASSLGKAIAAFQTEERREKLLRSYGMYRFTGQTITDRTELEQEFARVRERGFATDLEESVCDGHCFAVPIFGSAGDVNVAVSLSLPKARERDSAHREEILAALRVTVDRIADALRGD
ncbi:MAG: IclR family transcriptional regulator [Bryobacteraceae bacterium]